MSDTPWQRATAQRRSKRQEESLAAEPGGSKQINSGRTWFSKRDVRLNGFLVEARTTDKSSYSISIEEFKKIVKDALRTPPGMLAAMQIDFRGLRLWVMRYEDHMAREARIAVLEGEIERLNGEVE